SDIAQSETQLQKQWKPISEPLQQLLEKVEPVKVKPENWKFESKTSTPQKSPLLQKLTPTNIYNRYLPTTTSFLEDTFSNLPEHSILQDVSGIEESRPDATVLERERDVDEQMIAHTREEFRRLSKTPGYQSYLEQFHPLPRQYIDEGPGCTIKMPIDKFGRHMLHSKKRDISSIFSAFLASKLFSVCVVPIYSNTFSALFYTFGENSRDYIVPVTGIVDSINIPPKIRVKCGQSDVKVDTHLSKGDILNFYSSHEPKPDLIGNIVMRCPIIQE
ncbi:unnamed protein product, partial [Acanthoscelides obtectus]